MLTKCHSALCSPPVSYLGISAHRPCILLEDFYAFPMKTMPEISIHIWKSQVQFIAQRPALLTNVFQFPSVSLGK